MNEFRNLDIGSKWLFSRGVMPVFILVSLLWVVPSVSRAVDTPAQVFGIEQFDYKIPNTVQRLRCFQALDDDQASAGKALAVTLDKQQVRLGEFPILTVPGLDKPALSGHDPDEDAGHAEFAGNGNDPGGGGSEPPDHLPE